MFFTRVVFFTFSLQSFAFSSEMPSQNPYAPSSEITCELRNFGKKRPTVLDRAKNLTARIKALGETNPEIYFPTIDQFEHLKIVNKTLLPDELLEVVVSRERILRIKFGSLEVIKTTTFGGACGAACCLIFGNGIMFLGDIFMGVSSEKLARQNLDEFFDVVPLFTIPAGFLYFSLSYFNTLLDKLTIRNSQIETFIYLSSECELERLKKVLLENLKTVDATE